jgi:hypothetical protein
MYNTMWAVGIATRLRLVMRSRNGERSDFCYRQARFSWGSSRHLFNGYLEVKRPVFESDDLYLVARLKKALNYFRSPRRLRWAQRENFSFAFTFTFRYRLARVLFTPQRFAVTTLDSTRHKRRGRARSLQTRGFAKSADDVTAPFVTAGQLLTSSKLGRQKTMTWQVDQWRYRGE